jgi:ring-1,2-phenylacetyl-CoA epoxidase subunit PaaC
MTDALVSLLTALGDDELIIGHRHSEWTGHAPHIEEDVAFSSIAQDEIGHAAAYFRLAGEATGTEPDRLAFGRDAASYRHAILCEKPNGDWAYTLARHWLYDEADDIRLGVLEGSTYEPLAQLATKMRREERWHLLHADMWMKKVASGPLEGRIKVTGALAAALKDAAGLFEPVEDEADAIEEGLLPIPMAEQESQFNIRISEALDSFGFEVGKPGDGLRAEFVASSSGDLLASAPDEPTEEPGDGRGGRRGDHGEGFEELWDVMTRTYREHPGARW